MQSNQPQLLPVDPQDAYRTALILEAARKSAAEKVVIELSL